MSQFSPLDDKATLARYIDIPGVYPAGRLDYDSEGLLLLTSDGDLAAHLTHPRHGIEREYEVRVKGVPDAHDLDRLSRGISLDGRRTAPAIVQLTKVIEAESGPQALLSFVIHEGRNRQVRNMCDAIGHPVVQLRRVRIGPIADDRLKPGQFRPLTPSEVSALKKGAPGPEFKERAAPITATARPSRTRPAPTTCTRRFCIYSASTTRS